MKNKLSLLLLTVFSFYRIDLFAFHTESNEFVKYLNEKDKKADTYLVKYFKSVKRINKYNKLTDYLPLSGGALNGHLSGTSANFSNTAQAGSFYTSSGSYQWGNIEYSWSSSPRITPPNSITLYDQYGSNGSPTPYGTILDLYGRNGHLNSQLYFGESGQLYYRHSFYGESNWSAWQTILTSTNIQNQYLPIRGSSIESTGDISVTTGSYRWSNNQYSWSTAPRSTPPNSITIFDQYGNEGGSGSPTGYGTMLDLYGRNGHLNSQLYFGESGQLLYRHAFYGEQNWPSWQTLVTSANVQQHALPLSGGTLTGNLNGTSAMFNGNLKTKKLIISQTGWPDYVFEPAYQLQPLSELSAFIQQYKHLPDMPSAKEVAEKGISVGDNQALLLRKIEELTLYVIDLDTRNKQFEEKNIKLEEKVIQLQKAIKLFNSYKR